MLGFMQYFTQNFCRCSSVLSENATYNNRSIWKIYKIKVLVNKMRPKSHCIKKNPDLGILTAKTSLHPVLKKHEQKIEKILCQQLQFDCRMRQMKKVEGLWDSGRVDLFV